MPTYEYACRSCGKHLEVVQSFADDPLDECPSCAGPLRKVYGQIGIVFKGNGFYKTDSRSTATPSASKASDAKVTSSKDAKAPSSGKEATKGKPGASANKSGSKPATPRAAAGSGG